MKAIRKHTTTTLLAISLLFTLASCVQDDLFNTPHPDRGVVAVSTDFPQEAAGEVVIAVDGEPLDGTESHPLTPGLHTLLAYNLPPGFSVTDGIAYVDAASDTRALAAVIAPLPGYLYSGTQLVEVTADDTVRVGLHVTRRVRDLRIELDVTEGDASRIVSATGTLTGVAGAFDLRAETLTGEPVATVSDFAHEGGTVAADFRLLGTMGGTQTFTLVLTFTDGYTQTVESDLTDILSDFNGGDYTQRFTVTGDLSVPVQGSVGGCTITVSLGGETAAYTYDGNTWTSTAPLYWQNTETATVNAWYPTAENVSLADQSEGLAYVLKGSGTGSYQSGVNLTFTHQLAKVRVELTGEKASDVQKVEIYSYTTCTHNQGTISTDGASQNWITMHKVDEQSCYEANVVPGTITLDKFIRLNGSSVATVSGITDLAAGAMYTVNLNVKSPIPSDAKDITGDISNDGNYVVSGSRTTAINITGGSPHIYLDGATVSVSSGNAISITGNATPTIHVVGTNTVSSSNGAGIYVAQGSTVTITGDSRNDVLTSTGGAGSAGIGSYSTSDGTNYSCGNITISNVTLTARSEGSARAGDYAAGIGSAGVGTVGSISISDATIYAQGYGDNINMGAAAIGGGVDGTSSDIQTAFDITISNSTIHATRGCPHASYIGAGGLNGIKPAGYNIISTARITDSHVYDESGNEITQ